MMSPRCTPTRNAIWRSIGDTVVVTVTVAELMPEKSRARLFCLCEVDGEVVLDGEALVKVPSEKTAKGTRPVMRL